MIFLLDNNNPEKTWAVNVKATRPDEEIPSHGQIALVLVNVARTFLASHLAQEKGEPSSVIEIPKKPKLRTPPGATL